MYINKVFLYGNLTRDPELKSLPSGTQVAEFGLATNRFWKDQSGNRQEDTEFHNIVIFGKQAETVSQYLKKGKPVFLEGRIRTRSWEGQDGNKKYRTEIVADRFQFGPKPGEGSSFKDSGNNNSESRSSSNDSSNIDYPEDDINAEDIPF